MPGEAPPFIASSSLLFDSLEGMQRALAPHQRQIMSDVKNFTDIRGTVMVSEVTAGAN
jgi:uncharacterized protein (TIGR02118 family)